MASVKQNPIAVIRINELKHLISYKEKHITHLMEAGKELGPDHEMAARGLAHDCRVLIRSMYQELWGLQQSSFN